LLSVSLDVFVRCGAIEKAIGFVFVVS
jgi:hypothetical protein